MTPRPGRFAPLCSWLLAVLMVPAACGGTGSAVDAADGGGTGRTTGEGGALTVGSSSGGATASGPPLTPGVFAGTGSHAGSCLGLGAGCTNAGDCCSGDCTGNVCRYPACTSDRAACGSNGECCSQSCAGGTCAPLDTACKTLGNGCASGSDCCSGLCSSGTCQASSFCGQGGDACSTGADCCTGTCTLASGAALGTCGANPPGGPANCGVVDGQLCGPVPSGGATLTLDAGLPACGGPCCSRACAPWGPTGALVCQPASGCHVVGDLCTRDADCCGSAGLPGGSGKPVTCDIASAATVGVCRNPMGCKPDGDVCKLQTMSCNASCDCCSGNCETMDTCKQDNLGVPRCASGQCAAAGAACASSANCCGGTPCVPNSAGAGAPPYVCAGTSCVAACGACTNSADCCPGTSCVTSPGSTQGVCGPCGSAPGGDAGTGALPDGGAAGSPEGGGTGPSCALYGQVCTVAADCCGGVPCDGRCELVTR